MRRTFLAWLLRAALALICTLSGLAAASPARADGDYSRAAASGCRNQWTWIPYGARFRLAAHWNTRTRNYNNTLIQTISTHVRVDGLTACNAQGAATSAYDIRLAFEYHFMATNVTGCAVGLPANVTCTFSPSEIVLKYHKVCRYEVRYCDISDGLHQYWAPAGARLTGQVRIKASTGLIRSDGRVDGLDLVEDWV